MQNSRILTEKELADILPELKGWEQSVDALHATMSFKDFGNAIDFINQVAQIAEKLDHHPKITNLYRKVELSISTHEAGDKITHLDVDFAREVNTLLYGEATSTI